MARLAPDDIARYQHEGWIVPPYRIPDDRLAHLRGTLDRLIRENPDIRPERLVSIHIEGRNAEGVRGSADFLELARDPALIDMVAQLIGEDVILWGCQIFCKPGGDGLETPWHQDGPYYFVEGRQTVSFWSPVDPVTDASLRCVAGSHLWPREVLPTRWLAETAFYPDPEKYLPVPDPDAEGMTVLEWEMEPGDAVAFHFRTLHGARGNLATARRRAFSLRLVGDDARYVERPGRTSPPYPGHGMVAGQTLREDWFPYLL